MCPCTIGCIGNGCWKTCRIGANVGDTCAGGGVTARTLGSIGCVLIGVFFCTITGVGTLGTRAAIAGVGRITGSDTLGAGTVSGAALRGGVTRGTVFCVSTGIGVGNVLLFAWTSGVKPGGAVCTLGSGAVCC